MPVVVSNFIQSMSKTYKQTPFEHVYNIRVRMIIRVRKHKLRVTLYTPFLENTCGKKSELKKSIRENVL